MFKFAHKISSYGDESRIDFNLSKRKRNLRFKDKVLYLKDQTVLLKEYSRYWYKFLYVMNDEDIYDYKIGYYILKNNILHRKYDKKSVCTFCSKLQKQCFCNNKPAIVYSNGVQVWYVNGKRHREGGLPAVIRSNGDKHWYVNGKRHREAGLAAIINSNGYQAWYLNGKRHREGGLPAVIYSDGEKEFYQNGVPYTPLKN